MRRVPAALIALVLAIPAPVVAQTPTSAPAAPSSAGEGASALYQVGPGDLLDITVYRAPDLKSQVRVGSDGTIPFGAIGSVQVGGRTASDIATLLANQLKSRGILVAPSVNVLVTEVRAKTVMVMGSVARPGQIALDTPGMTLAGVLARSGAEFGTGNAIVTVLMGPNGDQGRERLRLTDLISGTADRQARSGEILVVQNAPSVYVSGEVGHAGAFPLQPGMTVGQALALGGGVTPRGSRNRIRLTRTVPGQPPKVYENVKFDMPVEADDLVFVKQRIF